ncbi:hypothetical protein TWF481_010322 [Arthrobotrys musiformis]|uniref:Azaphilone pigments biosynthesis cluster protein L N-terminal domain-containing protein n=1 Tax=Arthrobotrys musiformis TaxID=47236 RepID=A0AAV9W1L7_9PEZI
MEGIGVAANVIAVIDISVKLICVFGEYFKDVKNAKGDVQQLTKQVESLHGVLESVQKLIDGKNESEIPGIKSLKDSVLQCEA